MAPTGSPTATSGSIDADRPADQSCPRATDLSDDLLSKRGVSSRLVLKVVMEVAMYVVGSLVAVAGLAGVLSMHGHE